MIRRRIFSRWARPKNGALRGAGTPLPPAAGSSSRLDSARFGRIDAAMHTALTRRQLPGAVFHLERGSFTYDAGAAPVTTGTVFDAASLSKVLATAPAVLLLSEEGKFDLDGKLVDYFPDFAGGGKEAITIRHLLTHTSGLAAGLPGNPAWQGIEAAHARACAQNVTDAPGSCFRYSDINYVLLVQSPPGIAALRGLGMDIGSPFAQRGGYRRTKFTGCVLWIDPGSRTFCVLLSNRVYPDDQANMLGLYDAPGTLSARVAGLDIPAC